MANGVHIRKMVTRTMRYVIEEISEPELQRRITEHLLEVLKLLDAQNGIKDKAVKCEIKS